MNRNEQDDDRYNVTIYLADGRIETHEDVSAARAKELESVFGASPTVTRIDVCSTAKR